MNYSDPMTTLATLRPRRPQSARFVLIPLMAIVLFACSGEPSETIDDDGTTDIARTTPPADRAPVLAINVGGSAYTSTDGIVFAAEQSISGGRSGMIDKIKGSNDTALFQSYREGDIKIDHPVASGTYDITFYFAEPYDTPPKGRVFDIIAEDQVIIDDIDVMVFRDGKIISALTVTAPDLKITDGELNVRFGASAGEPILSGLSLRQKQARGPEWKLVWSDEFDGDTLDQSKWSYNVWPARKVNDEDQAYTARTQNVRVEDGMLIIEAHKETYDNAEYTSGRIHSAGKGDFTYGRFEISAKVPDGKGTWAAIWMLPSNPFTYATKCDEGTDWQGNPDCDAWPNSGEIDILEHVGYEMDHIHGTVHTKAYYWVNWEQRKGRIIPADVDKKFHVYAMEWSPERIDMFVDDSLYFTYINENEGWEHWPFDQPFHLIMNVAVGGWWGRAGGGIDESIFPKRMLVDYARVYALDN